MWRSRRAASTPCCSRKSCCSSRVDVTLGSDRPLEMANGRDQVDQNALAAEWGLSLDAEGGAKTDPAAAGAGEGQEAAAQQWAAAVDEGPSFGSGNKSGAERVLSQDEIDGLLGFSVA